MTYLVKIKTSAGKVRNVLTKNAFKAKVLAIRNDSRVKILDGEQSLYADKLAALGRNRA